MALQTFRGGIYFPHPPLMTINATAFVISATLDAGGEKLGCLFQAPKTGSIHKIGWRTRTVRTGATLDVRVETINASGQPSGTLWGTNTNASVVVGNGDDDTWFLTTLTADASVNRGDFVAVVFVNPSISPGDLDLAGINPPSRGHFPSFKTFSVSWVDGSGINPVLGIEYSDGTYSPIPYMMPVKTIATPSIDSGTTPDEAGMKFSLPFQARARGFWVSCSQPTDGDYTVRLYNAADSVIASLLVDTDKTSIKSEGAIFTGFFTATALIQKNRTYRLTILPATTFATDQTLSTIQVDTAAILDQFSGGQNFHYTQRTDGGSWSNDTTKRPLMGVICDQINAV